MHGITRFLYQLWVQNQSDLDFDLSALKVKSDGADGLPMHAFLLVFIFKIWPNSGPLRDTNLQNLIDRDFDR